MRFATLALSVTLATLAVLPGRSRALGLSPRVGVINNGGSPPAPWQLGLSGPFQSAPLLTLYPNPAHGLLTVQLSAQHGPDYKLRLSNVLGREVRLLALPLSTAANGLPLDVTGLPAGMYFCSLLVNDKAVSTNRLTLL